MVVRAWFICALAAACLAGLPERARAATWVEVRSPHFIVLSDAGERRAREVAWQFEQVRGAITRLWPWATTDFPLDVVVYAARDERSMKTLVPQYFEGRSAIRPDSVFVSTPMAHYIAVRSDIKLNSKGDINPYRSSYWSYMGLVIQTTFGGNVPMWFMRGLAEVFSNTVVRDDYLLVGQLIPWHLERLRNSLRPGLEAVLAADGESPLLNDSERMAAFDASAWGLMHYLMFGEEGRNLERMNQFAHAVRKGTDATEALSQVYGGMEGVKRGLASYIGQSLFMYQKVPADVSVDVKAFGARELPAADAAVALGRLHAGMQRPADARAQLATASDAPSAAEVEGLLLEGEGKNDQARAAYARASEATAATFFGEYRFAMLSWPREGAGDVAARLTAIEKSLRRAVTLNPKFAPTHYLLAQTLVRLDRATDALPLAQRAVTLAPFDSFSHATLARVYSALSRHDDAIASARRAMSHADSDTARKNAQNLLDFYARRKD